MGLDPITWVAIGSAVLGAAGAYASYKQGQQAQAAQRQAAQTSAANTQVNQQQAIRDQIRQERVRRAQVIAASGDTGTLASSGQLGAVGSLGSAAGQNIGTINRTMITQQGYYGDMQQAQNDFGRSSLYGTASALAFRGSSMAASSYGAQNDWDRLFGPPRTNINQPQG